MVQRRDLVRDLGDIIQRDAGTETPYFPLSGNQDQPFDQIPLLPPRCELETKANLK
jgi:hypothetical protein